ncbi:MAG TPA: MMPL family transporter [Solirubrobacterales bacterium]|nr:MMPL family transporter [Solirubrobacterales bacterium]
METLRESKDGRSGIVGRVADFAFRHNRLVVLGWLSAFVLALFAAFSFGGTYVADYNTPGSGSEAAAQKLDAGFGGLSGDQIDLVWKSDAGADSPGVTEKVDHLLREIDGIEGVVPGTEAETAEISDDGSTGVLRVPLDRASSSVPAASGEEIATLMEEGVGPGVTVAANANIAGLKAEPGMSSEMIGILVAALVLALTLGTVISAGLPLATALFGVGIAAMLGGILAAVLDTPDWALQVSLMIGIGVGIDYALLIITRYKTALDEGDDFRAANLVAMTTAGSSVLTAGATVVISLMGLFLMRLPYLYGVALSSSLAVLAVMLASVTLLPALLGMAGPKINRLRIGRKTKGMTDPGRSATARWARLVGAHPIVSGTIGLVLIVILALPVGGMRFGFPDSGNDSADSTTKQAYDMVADGFGPGANGPLIAVAGIDGASDSEVVDGLAGRIAEVDGVTSVSPPIVNPAGDTTMITITPDSAPGSERTKDLVDRLRDGVLAGSPLDIDLGGQTASSVDQGTVTAERLPLFIGAVVALSFLLLLGSFRAPIVALKAGVMTVLSIAASYGVVALVAQGGWAGQLIGIDTQLPVPPFIPVMMFAVLFGLSMDYEVFLISRIREERDRLGDSRAGVVQGLALTSKVIMAAAAIMIAVFGAFALSPDVMLKLIGVGLAAAILIDAVIVRLILVPAVMALLGDRAWWTPGSKHREPSVDSNRKVSAI